MRIRRELLATMVGMFVMVGSFTASAQVIFSDSDFDASGYDTSGVGVQDIRFGFDYGDFDIFGNGFLTGSIPTAPRTTDNSTTGVFLSANNDSQNPDGPVESFAAILPKAVNVGAGTANENYVLRVDAFHSVDVGIDDGVNPVSLPGTVNYAMVGLNYSNTLVQIAANNQPGGSGSGQTLSGQGLALAITGDGGASVDYTTFYGGARYENRSAVSAIPGTLYRVGHTGLVTEVIVEANGGDVFDPGAAIPNHRFESEDPNSPGSTRQYWLENFPPHNDPLHYEANLDPPNTLVGNDVALPGGVPYNRWATHEVYWVDGTFTYVINDVPVLQFTPDDNPASPDQNVFDPISRAGTAMLGFWDRFGNSIAQLPEGGNFIVFDNLEIVAASVEDVPDPTRFLIDGGFIVPEPATGLLLAAVVGLLAAARTRSARPGHRADNNPYAL